jgi:hypothetical protein
MVIVTVSDYQPIDSLESVSADLLKQWRAAIDKKTALTDGYLIANTLPHGGKGAIIS